MAAPAPKNYSISELKTSLLRPALTSNFEVYIQAIKGAKSFIEKDVKGAEQLLRISCSEASLPGSSLATHELNNDVTGVTQRNVYRRLYDDRIDLTFYVTVDGRNNYDQIKYFERWIQYISGEQENADISADVTYPHRVAWPDEYKCTIWITKFERSAQSKTGFKTPTNGSLKSPRLEYTFFNAYPISISSMPVSYDSSSLLKCTVSFTYDRYIAKKLSASSGSAYQEPGQSSATGVPGLSNDSNYWKPNSTFTNPQFDITTATNLEPDFSGLNALNSNVAPNRNNQQPNPGGIPSTGNAATGDINANIA